MNTLHPDFWLDGLVGWLNSSRSVSMILATLNPVVHLQAESWHRYPIQAVHECYHSQLLHYQPLKFHFLLLHPSHLPSQAANFIFGQRGPQLLLALKGASRQSEQHYQHLLYQNCQSLCLCWGPLRWEHTLSIRLRLHRRWTFTEP